MPHFAHISAAPAQSLPTLVEVLETLTFRAGFNASVVVGGTTLLGVAAGIVGVFTLLRRRSLTSDALSHATLPGVAGAFLAASFLGLDAKSLPMLLAGATLTGALGVASIQAMLRWTRLHEDAAIGIVLSVFFAVGVVLLSVVQKSAPAGSAGLATFIYGNAATLRIPDVVAMGGLTAAAMVGVVLFFKELRLICFNDGFARVDGWRVSLLDGVLLGLVLLVTVAGLQAVGLIMVVALLIVPAVSARLWTDRLGVLVLLAGGLGGLSGYAGSSISALLPNKPAGAVIVLTAGAIFVISLLFAPSRGMLASSVRFARLRLRISGDHLLEAAFDASAAHLSRQTLRDVATQRGWAIGLRPLVTLSLAMQGLAKVRPHGLDITPKGAQRGQRVSRNHALWEQYLISYADVAPNHVDWSVDQVEHVLSDELIAGLEARLLKRGVSVPLAQGPTR
ncbi:MAG: metal ABC transporter permease [Planctomycetota bacterium]